MIKTKRSAGSVYISQVEAQAIESLQRILSAEDGYIIPAMFIGTRINVLTPKLQSLVNDMNILQRAVVLLSTLPQEGAGSLVFTSRNLLSEICKSRGSPPAWRDGIPGDDRDRSCESL